MKNSLLGALILIVVTGSTVFFAVPQKASAQTTGTGCIGALIAGGGSTAVGAGLAAAGSSVPTIDTANLAQNTISAGANTADCIKNTMITPLARLLARIVLQQITASTINWITGSNGTGQSSFVSNLAKNLQGVGDAIALTFIAQTVSGFASPFGAAISASLRDVYAQQSSLAGFFASNQCTLGQVSPNINGFLSGNWSQGGVRTWFALTTQTQNNPFMLYQAAQSQLGSNIAQAQANRRQDLVQGGGFLSWCGPSDSGSTSGTQGVNPGDACIKDGVEGVIKTPGSVIHDYTQKAIVGAGIDQLVSATDIDQALGAVAVALVSQVLGSGDSGGLANAPRSSAFTQIQSYSASNASATASAISIAETKLAQLSSYMTAWQTITTSANTASTSAASLANFCTAAADTAAQTLLTGNIASGGNTAPSASQNLSTASSPFIDAARAQAVAAQTAITTEIAPIFVQTQAAFSSASTTQAFALKVEAEASSMSSVNSATSGTAGTVAADTQTLIAMPPSATDVSNAQQNAQVFGGATASPTGSLTVSGGSIVDRMNLITANAAALKTTVCNPSSSLYTTTITQGG